MKGIKKRKEKMTCVFVSKEGSTQRQELLFSHKNNEEKTEERGREKKKHEIISRDKRKKRARRG